MFNKDFAWGAATSAYQIEGGAFEDGKGDSIWDEYCACPDKIFDGQTGDVACDHYHRFKEDVALMAEIGLKAYRFSISWTRILPDGIGRVEQRGIAFYRDLIKELLAHDIKPYVTLFHWDYPAALMRKGGWLNPESPAWFEEYTRVVVENLGDLAENFITFNEPEMMFGNSFVSTNLAPGYTMADGDVIRMIHNMLIAHGLSVKAIRSVCPNAKIGVAPCSDPVIPEEETPELIEAARRLYYVGGTDMDSVSFGLSWYSDPMMLGSYPEDSLSVYGKYLPDTWQEDMKTICQPLDFFCQNIYTGVEARMNATGEAFVKERPQGFSHNALGWTIMPAALYWGPRFLYERYKLPVIISENGMCCHDVVSLDGKVHDPNRIDYLHRYLLQLKRAADENIPVAGYFQWSLMDNFEWKQGYNERFGIVYVDYATQKRIRKDSSYWYQEVIESNGESL